MATILSAYPVCDGYDVRVLTGNNTHTVHFLAEPSEAERDEVISTIEQRLLNELVDKHGLDNEETDNGIFDG